MGNLRGLSTRTNVNQKLALLHRQRACRPARSALFRTTGCRDSPTDWTGGRTTRYLVRRHRPSEPAEPVKVDRHQSRPGIGYSARKTAATGTYRVSGIGTATAWVHFPAPDWAVRRSWPMAHTWRWLRTMRRPPEMAGVAIRGSAMSLRARISNLGPALATTISPSSLER